ncbi:MAG: hypothetical protein HW387_1729, partial [Parachlamydiales bacterium]|nr:hypothetical protein [Parachlamydiales bacterium]
MAGYNNNINNTFLDIAALGTTIRTATTQVAVNPSIPSGSLITTGLLVNPAFSLSSGTFYGEQISPSFNPPTGNIYPSAYGLSVAPTITPTGSGSVTNAYGLHIAGPVISSSTITNAYSLYVATPSSVSGNPYTAVFGGSSGTTRVGVGQTAPNYPLDVNGTINVNRIYVSGTTADNQLTVLSQGYNQGGFGGGMVGTNKQMSANSTTCFDLGAVNAALFGFTGGVFDGRYIYFVPNTTSSASGTIARYDTALPFYATSSYTAFDTRAVNSASKGFQGGVFDGRYVYLVPNNNGAAFGQITRYDTTLSFLDAGSYTCFDTLAVSGASKGFTGGVFDGRYVYLVPNNSGLSGTITRYDTTMSFLAAGSYTCFDTAAVCSASRGFTGGVFDGRYVYLVPNNSGLSGTITRYDTTQSFTTAASYTCFNTTTVNSASKGFTGGVFDGRYVYLVPFNNGLSGTITRYDTTQSFFAAASYTCFGSTTLNVNSKGFQGAVFDGRYVYLVPSTNRVLTRLDAYPGPQATAMAASQAPNGLAIGSYAGTSTSPVSGLIVSGNVGIGTTSPQYTLDVNGTLNATSITGISIVSNLLGTTADNQLINIAEGYNQGGYGGGSVGTNKQMSAASTAFLTFSVVNSTVSPFRGGVFDGRYVYLVPSSNGFVARYDTTQSFAAVDSYTCFDTAAVNSASKGFLGGVFDGRYVYLVPSNNGAAFGQITRYDTTQSFTTAASYTCFDTLAVNAASKGFAGGVFDGRYVYLVPNNNATAFGQITRYDTTQSFTAAASYTCFDTLTVNNASKGFFGGVFDGRYVYLVPNNNGNYFGQITRYDTTQSFTAAASYTCFDTTTMDVNSVGFQGGVFDGRYVYLVPNNNRTSGTITRYDTTQSFTTAASYTYFDTVPGNGNSKGFIGGVFDGRYVYLVPNSYTVSSSGQITRYDTTQSFFAQASYSYFNTRAVNTLSTAFQGGVFDGRYIYLVPSILNTWTRLDTYPGPQATAMAASQAPNGLAIGSYAGTNTPPTNGLIVSGNVGVGTSSPQYTLDINGSLNADRIYSNGLLGSTANNQLINITEGYNQGGYGGGSVGTNKQMSAESTTCFDMSAVNAALYGFQGGVFDGRYVYLVPNTNSAASGTIARYDTTLPFYATGSYTAFDTAIIDTSSKGFSGGVFDGRYVYLVPNNSGASGTIT